MLTPEVVSVYPLKVEEAQGNNRLAWRLSKEQSYKALDGRLTVYASHNHNAVVSITSLYTCLALTSPQRCHGNLDAVSSSSGLGWFRGLITWLILSVLVSLPSPWLRVELTGYVLVLLCGCLRPIPGIFGSPRGSGGIKRGLPCRCVHHLKYSCGLQD